MKSITLNRREAALGVVTVTIGAFVPAGAAAQQGAHGPDAPPFPPKGAGNIHEDILLRISEKLGTTAINTEAGLSKLVQLLREWDIISQADAEKLNKLIDAIFKSTQDEIIKRIDELYETFAAEAGAVTAAILSIARSSIRYAKTRFKEHHRVVEVVCSDVIGALGGAVAGKKLGGYGSLIGALAGAVGASAKAAYE
jgi:hypothetical protein